MTTKPFKPMLSGTVKDFNKLRFPLLASPKLDGIRCVIYEGKALSRKLKPIPNNYVREMLESMVKYPLDGELMLRDPNADFNQVQSAIMSHDGTPNFYYAVFDRLDRPNQGFHDRYMSLQCMEPNVFVQVVEHTLISDLDALMAYEADMVRAGYEGVMVRSLDGLYKYGRSTENQGWLLKLKQFKDDEAVIVGFQEKMHNANEAKTDALGHTERSSCKGNLVPMGTLGAILLRWQDRVEFKVGTGFDDALKQDIWNRREELMGEFVKFKYQELSSDGVPRFPVFLAIRHKDDM